ncbi:MAG TPA: L-aspartate oxidase [Dehalococcoidia bacterium]|nr:L-aspartate oxidase [Dehalococcoidia bacterium]
MAYYDYVIIGSGITGLYTALRARKAGSVLIITKGSIQESNTKYAQGGIAAPISRDDSPELHYRDTIAAGAGLCNPVAVRILTEEATDRIAELIKFGVPFDTLNGEIALTKEAAHSLPRVLHAGGDATGLHIENTLIKNARDAGIEVKEYCLVSEIALDAQGAVCGVKTFNCNTGVKAEYECRYVILATGGAGQLYKYTTNSQVVTGDGIALAYQTGAEITDMEFFQFHPTVFYKSGAPLFLITEAVRGEGGVLRNSRGYRFMPDYDKAADLAPRDVVARSIVFEMQKTSSANVYLDVTDLRPSVITTRFPQVYQFCLDQGIDISKEYIPVAPAAHYLMGGVKVNIWGGTNVYGLFAAGETACTGVHGANRLASNSLLEVLVFSKRVVERTKQPRDTVQPKYAYTESPEHRTLKDYQPPIEVPPLTRENIQALMWDKVGIMRDGKTLSEAGRILYAWQKQMPALTDRESYELRSMIMTARMIVEAAVTRQESRGAHYRMDYPKPSDTWQKHIVFKKNSIAQ